MILRIILYKSNYKVILYKKSLKKGVNNHEHFKNDI